MLRPAKTQADKQIGLGWPAQSPSPFDALCVGVPFINPINYIDWDRPDDPSGWHTQNDAMLALGPPYVYHVRKENATQLAEALKQAIANPIPRYIREYLLVVPPITCRQPLSTPADSQT